MHGLSDSYDFAFSIGGACACTQALRRSGLQHLTFPLDWAGTGSIVKNANLIVGGFDGFLDESAYQYCGPTPDAPYDIYHNKTVGIYFSHDFPRGRALSESWQSVSERFRRRIGRFNQLMAESRKILVVYVELPSDARLMLPDMETTRDILRKSVPEARLDVLCISPQKGQSFAPENIRKMSENVFQVSFDYVSPGCACGNIDAKRVAAALKGLVRNVRDYRTSEERRKYRAVKRQKQLDLYMAANMWELMRNKAYYKLMRHFQNQLERKGFTFG